MAYETTIENVEDVDKAIDLAQQVLTEKGYRLSKPDAHTLHAKVPGIVQSNKDALKMANDIRLDYQDKRLRMRAELGGVRHLTIFMLTLIGGLGAMFTVMAGAMGGWHLPLMMLLPWSIIIPVMSLMFRQNAITALDTFAENIATVAGGNIARTRVGQMNAAPQPWGFAYILVGVGLLIATGVLSWQSLGSAFPSMRDGEMLATAPGEHVLFLEGPETYTIFHQHRTEFNGKHYNVSHELEGLELTLEAKEGGGEVGIETIEGYSNYSNPRIAGYSAFRFTVETPGAYELTTTYAAGHDKEESILSIVAFDMKDVTGGMAYTGLLIAFPLAGAFLIIIGFQQLRRGRAVS